LKVKKEGLLMGYVIGIDLGGTFIKAAALDPTGKVKARSRVPTEVSGGHERVVANMLATVKGLEREMGGETPMGLGIGVPGVLDLEGGIVTKSPNFPGWEGFPLKEMLLMALPYPVVLENDANAAAVGEKWLGAGRGKSNFLFITLGTGVGGGLIIDGGLWKGTGGKAGEFGHMVVEPDGPQCGCGGHGCLEVYASARGIVRMAHEALKAGKASLIREWADKEGKIIDPELVAQAALQGDSLALEVYGKLGRYLGIAIVDVINLLDLNFFILGGGISHAFPYFIAPLMQEVKGRIFGISGEEIQVVKAQCGEDAGLLGAGYLSLSKDKGSRGGLV